MYSTMMMYQGGGYGYGGMHGGYGYGYSPYGMGGGRRGMLIFLVFIKYFILSIKENCDFILLNRYAFAR